MEIVSLRFIYLASGKFDERAAARFTGSFLMARRSAARPGARRLGPALVVGAAVLLILRAVPLIEAYAFKVLGLHSPVVVALAALAAAAAYATVWILFARRPRAAAALLLGTAAAMALVARNAAAVAAAAVVLAVCALLGDALLALLLGRAPGEDDLATTLAAGVAAAGLLVLVLAETGALRGWTVAAVGAVVVAVRVRRARAVLEMLRAAVRVPRGGAPPGLEAAWLAFAALVLLALWAAAQAPDVSWDALAYHLPEARDIALTGRVRPLADLAPQSLLWRNYDAFLALGFFAGGEPVVRFLQFGVGMAVFAAALSLARRIGAASCGPLAVLALAAFPTAMLQLHAAYVDWPAALFATACAAELAGARDQPERLRAAGFLFGAAVIAKVFALTALPALAILEVRAKPRLRTAAAAAALALVALLPWAAWSQRRVGSWTEPFAPSLGAAAARAAGGHYFRTSPATGEARGAPNPGAALRRLATLPYDVVFHSSRYEANGDGYNGIAVLLLLLGVLGWGASGAGLFVLAAMPVVAVWSLLYIPSVRFLFPMYPMYAVFTAEGLRRLTRGFAGNAGIAAGAAVLTVAAALPVQLGSSGVEWRVATGRMSGESSLAARLPAMALWPRVSASDRVVLLGENDRFHCPAGEAWRAEFVPVARWGRDPEAWRDGLRRLGITRLIWREDRVPANGLIEALGDTLRLEARSGPASLYAVAGAGEPEPPPAGR
jgi:hypothetical protein